MQLSMIQLASLTLLILFAVAAGLSYRRAQLELTESDIIETYAARYLQTDPQAERTDCRAVAGEGQTRMIVICGPVPFQADLHYEYHVSPLGGLLAEYGPADWATRAPQAGRNGV